MLINSTFKSAWWLNNPHLQTLYPTFCRRVTLAYPVKRERLVTPDNDFVDVDWCGSGNGPLVILLHGLTGNSHSTYIQGLQNALGMLGWRTAALNFRGCSGEYNNTAFGYHSGFTEDLQFLYETLRQREPNTPMAAIGFSLGGNMLLKWLGENGKLIKLFAASAISVPLTLSHCATRLESGFSKLYNYVLLYELKAYVQNKHQHLISLNRLDEADKLASLGNLQGIRSFWEFDDRVIAKLYGFKDVHDYYEQSSARQFLKAITVPTLVIQAIDDPFMTAAVLPELEELSSMVDLEVTSGGGHVGFISGSTPWRTEYWLESRVQSYLAQKAQLFNVSLPKS